MDNMILFDAVESNDIPKVTLLLQNGADPNIQNNDNELSIGVTPLHNSAKCGFFEITKLLLENGADPNIQTNEGITPLHWSAANNHIDITKILIKYEANVNSITNYCNTPLHNSVIYEFTDMTKLLLDNGADPNIENINGEVPLHFSIQGGNNEITKLLLDYGANTYLKHTNMKYSPLYYSIKNGSIEITKMILEKTKNNIKNNQTLSQILLLSFRPYSKVQEDYLFDALKIFLKYNMEINYGDNDGNTLLHLSIIYKKTEIARYLLENGADPYIKNNDGKTAFETDCPKYVTERLNDYYKELCMTRKEALKKIFPKYLDKNLIDYTLSFI